MQGIFAVDDCIRHVESSLFFRHEQMTKLGGQRILSVHARVLDCKETVGASSESHSTQDYLPGEQPFDGFFSQLRKSSLKQHIKLMCYSSNCTVVASI